MKTKLLFVTLTAVCTGVLGAAEAPQVGAPAPNFSLPAANGKTYSLGDFKGKYVVLEWFNPGLPLRAKALQERQHAEPAEGIHRQRRRLADD